ncbi:MAG: helix-turn-helix transcriptional regulator [Dehalococcoidia bacterium]
MRTGGRRPLAARLQLAATEPTPVPTLVESGLAMAELERGAAALRAGQWVLARAAFSAVLAREDIPEAHDGLAEALSWLGDVATAIAHGERAYAGFRRDTPRRAALVALWLAREHLNLGGRRAIANGWLNQAERLLEDQRPCVEHAWLEWFRAKLAPSPAEEAAAARRALESAAGYGNAALEALALSQLGRAHVQLGQLREGMDELDAAVAAVTGGEIRDAQVIADTCCNLITACETAADYERGVEWCQFVNAFTQAAHLVPFFARCRQVYASILLATGRWSEAEHELLCSAEAFAGCYPALRIVPLGRLAVLRVRQGRLEEAEQLIAGQEVHGAAAQALAAMHLARRHPELATAVLRRQIAALGETALVTAPLLALLAEADPASDAGGHLVTLAERTGLRPIAGLAALAMARTAAAPRPYLERATVLFAEAGMPYEAAVGRAELAQLVADTEPDLARAEAQAALAVFDALGAQPWADKTAALLRRLGVARGHRRVVSGLSGREREVLRLVGGGLTNAEIGERLFVSRKTAEHHVASILGKLGLRNRAEVVAHALRLGEQSGNQ